MPRLQFKRFAEPDDTRAMPLGHADLVHLDDTTVGMARWEPGWRWSTHLQPMVGTASCPVRHLGYSISGFMRVVTDDGQTLDIPPGSVYEIPAGHDAMVIGDEAWVTLEWTSADVVAAPAEGTTQRLVATLLFTDIVDSTATLRRVGDRAWRGILRDHNDRLRHELNRFRGRELATTGDGFLAVFDGATRAVHCGLAMTEAARAIDLEIRVGVHTGEVEFAGADVRGMAVHTAARVMSAANAGEVLVSATTRDLLEGSGLVVEDAGEHQMKGLSGPRTLYRVVAPSS
jgi:class 3 adenylate cyclase